MQHTGSTAFIIELSAAKAKIAKLREVLAEIELDADTNMEGAGEPEFSQFSHIAAKAHAALEI